MTDSANRNTSERSSSDMGSREREERAPAVQGKKRDCAAKHRAIQCIGQSLAKQRQRPSADKKPGRSPGG
jgi:hypothetical protein